MANTLYTAVGLACPPIGAFLAEPIGVGPVFAITGAALAALEFGLLLVPRCVGRG